MTANSDSQIENILSRLEAVEKQNRQILELLAKLAVPVASALDGPLHCNNPYAYAKQLAREGRRAESLAETKRVSNMIMAEERAQKKKSKRY
ncbi:MAG: hypothetical protein KKC76_03875 [Proteobacteria bacterium]|nr:hypothetical protein [Pseudomonadota bacterium]MBU4294462.1 hypothetical protein [Pseudomonadota bacterium]MCG2749169.1 hypothetical protein [Desulfobulbaceae bacterium]